MKDVAEKGEICVLDIETEVNKRPSLAVYPRADDELMNVGNRGSNRLRKRT